MSKVASDDSAPQSFDQTISQTATIADLDMEQVRVFLQQERVLSLNDQHVGLSEQQQMEALGLLQGEHPSYGALLCFGHHPSRQIAGAYTRCIYWRDTRRLSGWLDDKEYRGSLLQQFTQACDFLQKHLNFGRVIERGGSSEQPEFPFWVLEEALVNALIHREYVTEPDHTPRAEAVMVEIFPDRIEISSPGGPPANVQITALQKAAEQHPGSQPRNPQILRIFYLAGHVERIGAGLEGIQERMQEAGLPLPVIQLDEQTQTFSIILHRPGTLTIPEEAVPSEPGHAEEATNTHRPDLPTLQRSSRLRRPYRFVLTLLVIVIVLVVVFRFGPGTYVVGLLDPTSHLTAQASTTIEIASELPISGVDSTIGLPVQNGIQMAINDANRNRLLPGYTFKLTPYDDVGKDNRHDPLVGENNLKNAIADNLVAGIIGPYNSIVARAELPIANQAPIALISPSTSYPCLTKNASIDPDCSGSNDIEAQMRPTGQLTYFRLSKTDDEEGKAGADYFFNVQHFQKVLLIKDDSDPYSYGLARAFQEEWTQLHGQVIPLGLPENASSVQDYQNTLQAEIPFQPDLIYFAGNDPNGTYVLQALSNIPQLKTVTFAATGGIIDSSFLQAAAQLRLSNPIYATLSIQDPAHAETNIGANFEQNYKADGYHNYQPYAAAAYDCAMMLMQTTKTALQKKSVSTPHGAQDQVRAKQFRQAILQELAHLTYTGATGTNSFDTNGDTTNQIFPLYKLDLSNSQPSWAWNLQIKVQAHLSS